MPEVPSGLYLADGFVITSMRSIELAGNCCNTSALVFPIKGDGRPLIRISTASEPLKLTLPSISTSTEGIFFNTSLAVPLCAIISCVTLYTLRSIEVFSTAFFPVTVTSFMLAVNDRISILPRLSLACLLMITGKSVFAKPIKLQRRM